MLHPVITLQFIKIFTQVNVRKVCVRDIYCTCVWWQTIIWLIFVVILCISDIKCFIVQLMHSNT